MKTWFFISIVGMALIAGACTSTFLVSKGGHTYFLGSSSKTKYALLCASGDIAKILAATNLSKDMKDDLYKYNCSAERSGEKIKQIYATMTPVQRKDIRNAFKDNGYTINGAGC